MPTVFFLTKLKQGVTHEAYEQKWIYGYDYPTARTIPCILSYRYFRLGGVFRRAPKHYDFLEIVEVTDLDEYRQALDALPDRQKLLLEVAEWVEASHSFWGRPLENTTEEH